MNIKYVSLLSLLCIFSANAEQLSIAEQLEQAKKEWLECLKSQGNCDLQEREYWQTEENLRNHCAKKATKITTQLQDTKYQIFRKYEIEKKALSFERVIHHDIARFGFDKSFHDYDGSLEDFLRSFIIFDYCKNDLERTALEEASENVIQSFQEQLTE